LGDRRLIAQFQSLSSFTNFNFIYFNLQHRVQTGFALFDDRTFFIGIDNRGEFERGRRVFRQTGALALASYPLSRYYRLEGQIGYISRKFDFPFIIRNNEGTQFFAVDARSDNFPTAGVSFVGDTVLYEEWGPLSGRRFQLSYSYSPNFSPDDDNPETPLNENSSTLSSDITVDLRHYFKITQRSLIAVRLFGARSTGSFPNVYYFGGLDTLRGLDFREQIGNTIGYANFEYRFPLIDILATPILTFRDIRGQVFLDVGGAALEGAPFQFWDSNERQLVNGVAAYGFGFQIGLLGLQLHWDFAKEWDFKKTLSGLKTSFYIGTQF
ncbi:MAG TPA: hypothetical protein VFW15_03070, partial [Thermoanaerobaculia bacterium]|nr:hypothetical protein [Thermoanaerobaculia bacterium]